MNVKILRLRKDVVLFVVRMGMLMSSSASSFLNDCNIGNKMMNGMIVKFWNSSIFRFVVLNFVVNIL